MTSVSKTNDNGQPAVKAEPKNRIAEVEKTDPFDNLDSLRLSQDYAAQAPVKKVLTTVPCRKPNRHEFVRVRAGEDWRFETTAFEDKVNRETYLVSPELRAELFDETFNVCLFVTTNRQKDIFLWPVRLPGLTASRTTGTIPQSRPHSWLQPDGFVLHPTWAPVFTIRLNRLRTSMNRFGRNTLSKKS